MVRTADIATGILRTVAVILALGLTVQTRSTSAAEEQADPSQGMPTEEVSDIRKAYCGNNPVLGEGCARDGFAVMSHMTTRDGQPVRSWSLMGRKSGTIFTTECYCVIDE